MNLERIEQEYDDWANGITSQFPDEVADAIPDLLDAARETVALRAKIKSCVRIINAPGFKTNPAVAFEDLRHALL